MADRRRLSWDWYSGFIPENVAVDETAYVETSYSFHLSRSRKNPAVTYARGSSTYLGTMFDLGENGRVSLGEYALVHGARIICDAEVSIGDHALISWNVVIMDNYRCPFSNKGRRALLKRLACEGRTMVNTDHDAKPISIEKNVWIGFDACILPGVTIGEGSVIAAKSVVFDDVAPFTVAAGNPARPIRSLSE